MLQTINNKIRRGFSGSAKSYDHHTALHRQIADKLFDRITDNAAPSALLDVGCGTGYLTSKFKNRFPKANIVGLDFAQGMIEIARSKDAAVDWVLADSNSLPFAEGSFDIVTSNLAYQWAEDLSLAFREGRRVLVSKGILACTLFGYHTCRELFECLNEAKKGSLQFTRLPDEGQIRAALINSGFKGPQVEHEQSKIEFKDMHELMVWLKSIGANHLSREGFLGPEVLSKAASIYQTKFPYLQGVGTTFEVIRVYAKK